MWINWYQPFQYNPQGLNWFWLTKTVAYGLELHSFIIINASYLNSISCPNLKFWRETIHCKYKWLKWVSNPPLLRVLFETFKIIDIRKNSRQTSRESIKIDQRHFQVKWASSRQNSTQIVLFLSNFSALFFFRAQLELFLFTQFRVFFSL